jgi:hypothetical protein
MQQGPVPTQLCCGTSKLGGARPTRMKESHEVYEIRQGTSDERPLCWRRPQRYVLRQSYTVGYLYVTGTVTAQSSGNGIISGFKIDHNTGKLTPINGLPISSGGANPVRAVLLSGSRFLYVLNRASTPQGGSDCTTATPARTPTSPSLRSAATAFSRRRRPSTPRASTLPDDRRFLGNFLYVLDHDSPQPRDSECAAVRPGAGRSASPPAATSPSLPDQPTTGRLRWW